MNPWTEVTARIDAGGGNKLAPFLATLDEHGRRAVADQLPGYLSERLAQGWEGRRWVQDRTDAFRIAGAACLNGAAQVAAWLNRRDLRWVREPEADAARILALIGDRPAAWREDLAVRLVERVRPPSGSASRLMENGVPGWDLAAGLVLETGIEPPDSDAFTAGWLWRLVRRHWMNQGTPDALAGDPLPALPPLLTSPEDLAWELEALRWPDGPPQFERILAALIELTHRDRDAVAQALRPWWHKHWRQPFDPTTYVYGISGFDRTTHALLMRCALAVVAPADSRKLSALLADHRRGHPDYDPPIQLLVQRRLREVVEMLEAGRSVPVLLATPTSPTGHVDAETLIERMERMERLEGAEPLQADFHQALLRLPREIDPRAAVRAEGLTSRAGRTLAEWLRRGGLPDPEVTVGMQTAQRPYAHWNTSADHYITVREMYVRIAPPAGVPEPVAELCTGPATALYDVEQTVWWPAVMPSHREVVAAHLLETLTLDIDSSGGGGEVLAALVHGDGPVGAATASALAIGMGNKHPAQRGAAVDTLVTLTARGQLPAADLGQAVARLADAGLVKLNRITAAMDEATTAGAHAAVWCVLLRALPPLLPRTGDMPRAGLGELLAVAVKAATLSGQRAGVPGLAEVAARGGSSRLVQEARRLQQQVSR
ncbi:DUF6493 family protein [Microbispora sp. H13382]|uniref:DUF7824 domain-containing protein n=1 Tax=Microbispora sp. H13382 TaxID=2729112 RepID=UPI0015FFFF89|nr:DUF6493 family protein [Microbispora sp. H13382]